MVKIVIPTIIYAATSTREPHLLQVGLLCMRVHISALLHYLANEKKQLCIKRSLTNEVVSHAYFSLTLSVDVLKIIAHILDL